MAPLQAASQAGIRVSQLKGVLYSVPRVLVMKARRKWPELPGRSSFHGADRNPKKVSGNTPFLHASTWNWRTATPTSIPLTSPKAKP